MSGLVPLSRKFFFSKNNVSSIKYIGYHFVLSVVVCKNGNSSYIVINLLSILIHSWSAIHTYVLSATGNLAMSDYADNNEPNSAFEAQHFCHIVYFYTWSW